MTLFNSISKIASVNTSSKSSLVNSSIDGNSLMGMNEISILANTNVGATTNTNLNAGGLANVNAKTTTSTNLKV